MPSNGTTNGATVPRYSYPPGIHVPSLTWFNEQQEIDWDVQEKHFEFLISNGLHGIVIAGTNGEAATLSSAEKTQLVQRCRKTAQRLGRSDLPIAIGGVAGCTREAIQQTVEAKEAGATAFLALVPSYFHFAMDQAAIVAFFTELADASPIPIIIYNFPGVVSGLDVNSEMLNILGKHPNIPAVKLTCGGIAKVARISAAFKTSEFCALAGQSDWLIPAMSIGGTGCITGVANLYPKVCIFSVTAMSLVCTVLTHDRHASRCTTCTRQERRTKHPLFRSSFQLPNGGSQKVASMERSGLWRRREDILQRVRTADGRTLSMPMRRSRSGS
jgi:4-hydroxy-2-oxoglutarate aldolase